MKYILFTTTFILSYFFISAQTFQVKDLESSVGKWEGKLTYIDYITGKPFTMLANIRISLTDDKKGYVAGYEYPKEPHANSKDTTYVVDQLFGKDRIVAFKKDSTGGFNFITEIDGEDGNDNKKAVLRHTYQLKSTTFSIKKEVKFEGSEIWIKRNEYLFTKTSL